MGANISINSVYDFDYTLLNFSQIYYAESFSRTSTVFRATYDGGDYEEYRGTGLRYSSSGVPTGGTVTSYLISASEVKAIITGFSVAATAIVSAANSGSYADDQAIIAQVLTGSDVFSGGSGADNFNGYAGNDKLSGNFGIDTLVGGRGNDVLHGGRDKDYLTGGSGADTFLYFSVKESRANSYDRDTIHGFTSEDKIDLSAMDANATTRTNNTFTFLGEAEFTGRPGQLRYEKTAFGTDIYADINGDAVADMSIYLDTIMTLDKGFFVL
jgi:Ca2+-binding RTX toxin-like protein